MSYAACLFCGEANKTHIETAPLNGIDTNFLVCECGSKATIVNWQHPVARSQVCLVCVAADRDEARQAHDFDNDYPH